MRIAALLLAAGTGSRFGGPTPKQFLTLGGRPAIRHSAEALLARVDHLQPVGDAGAIETALAGLAHASPVPGGDTRQSSVRAGLEALAALPADLRPDLVLVHDAARPYLTLALIERVIAALARYRGAIPGVAVADTLKRVAGGYGHPIGATVSREALFRAQTPQGFDFATLLELHRSADPAAEAATDDAALLEAAGHPVALVEGDEDNIKLTFPEDYARMERLLAPPAGPIPRVGNGYDVHAFETGRPLVLCGVTIAHDRGLAGHSDADVGIHALCDAIYGALAEGDIGRHFPPSEATWKDADSARFLTHAAGRIAARGGVLCNADITLICEFPKITPHAPAMRARLAELLGVSIDLISVKATTSERLGFTGRGEGIACQTSVALLVPAAP